LPPISTTSYHQLPSNQLSRSRVFWSNQGSQKVKVGESFIAYPSMIRDHTLQILRVEQRSKPRIGEAFAKILLVAIPSLEGGYPELFSFFSPSRSILRTVGPILFSATTVRCRDVSLPSSSAVALTSPRPHGLTIVEPRVAITRYLSWFG
jgi:hypothetical protein